MSTSKLMFPFESVAMIAYFFRQVNPSDASGQPERDDELVYNPVKTQLTFETMPHKVQLAARFFVPDCTNMHPPCRIKQLIKV